MVARKRQRPQSMDPGVRRMTKRGRRPPITTPKPKKGAGVATDAPPRSVRQARYAAWGRAAFACATIAAKAAVSCIAMSARTFRSRSMLASFRPCMNCE
jgi:hypothetical protein